MSRITFVSRMTVKAGREAEFVGLCKELTAIVREKEPEILWFDFFKLREQNRSLHSPNLREVTIVNGLHKLVG